MGHKHKKHQHPLCFLALYPNTLRQIQGKNSPTKKMALSLRNPISGPSNRRGSPHVEAETTGRNRTEEEPTETQQNGPKRKKNLKKQNRTDSGSICYVVFCFLWFCFRSVPLCSVFVSLRLFFAFPSCSRFVSGLSRLVAFPYIVNWNSGNLLNPFTLFTY